MLREVTRFKPSLVLVDPISAFIGNADQLEVQAMMLRMVDFLKARGVTGVFTHLTHGQGEAVETDVGLSSLMDAWILLLNRESSGEFNRELYLLKARGTAHSNQVREFVLSNDGIKLVRPYIGEGRALTGSARRIQEAQDRRREFERAADAERKQAEISQRRQRVKAEIDALNAELEADELELGRIRQNEEVYEAQAERDRLLIEQSRRA